MKDALIRPRTTDEFDRTADFPTSMSVSNPAVRPNFSAIDFFDPTDAVAQPMEMIAFYESMVLLLHN